MTTATPTPTPTPAKPCYLYTVDWEPRRLGRVWYAQAIDMNESESLIRFKYCGSKEQALQLVSNWRARDGNQTRKH